MYALRRRADVANLRYLKSLGRPDPPLKKWRSRLQQFKHP